MGDDNIGETTDEYGRRVTIGADGSRTVEIGEVTIEGDPDATKREKDLQNEAALEAGRLQYQKEHPEEDPDLFGEARHEEYKEFGSHILEKTGETLVELGEGALGEAAGAAGRLLGPEALLVEFAAQTFGVTADPSSKDFGPRATCPGICPTCPDELQQNIENHCTLGAGHLDQDFSSGHICDRQHTWM
jgi:hypothetical protein